jgi:hypothetical protein
MLRWIKALVLAGVMGAGVLAVDSTAHAWPAGGYYGGVGGYRSYGYYGGYRPYYLPYWGGYSYARPYSYYRPYYGYRSYYRPYSYGYYNRPYSYYGYGYRPYSYGWYW